jgi:hypothetical protein
MAYVYLHKTKDEGTPFYIGISSVESKKYHRANSDRGRNQYWKNVVNKNGYEIEILKEGITFDEAKELEKQYIKEYKDRGYKLVNMTEGGDGTVGYKRSKAELRKIKGQGKRKYTVGSLIKKLKEYDENTPVYFAFEQKYFEGKYIHFDGVSVVDRKMIADDTPDEDGRYYESDYERCAIIVQSSKVKWMQNQIKMESERNELEYKQTYFENLTKEQEKQIEDRINELDNSIKIIDKFS